jgi:hypothetical protein
MCFSASASLIAGGVLSAAGVATVAKVTTKKELPFALVPLLFGVQQLTEGLVWLSLSWNTVTLNLVATYLFSLFAFVLWPVYVPLAIGLLETVPWRKKVIYVLQVLGLMVGGYLLYFYTLNPVSCEVTNNHLAYNVSQPHGYGLITMVLYFAATIISCLVSSKKIINLFGVTAFILASIAYGFYAYAFISVWCFFAAILSIIVYWYFTNRK